MSPSEVASFLFDGPVRNLWPLICLPWLAGLISDRCARRLPLSGVDRRVAAALAALPGIIMLGAAAVAIGQAFGHLDPHGAGGVILRRVTPLVALAVIVFAAARSWLRHAQIRRLTRLARMPQPRLARAADACGVQARQLPGDQPLCFVAGIRQPIAYVSCGVVHRLDDLELRAVLAHEAAHAAQRDPAWLSVLALLADLAPRCSRALAAYRRAIEQAADRSAARAAGAVPLAAALLALGGGVRSPLPVVGIAAGDTAWRIRAVLSAERPSLRATALPSGVRLGLLFNCLLAFWPLPQVALLYAFCTG